VLAIFTQTNNGSCTATPFTVRNTTSTLKLKFLGFQVRFGPTPTQNRTGFGQSRSIAPVDPPKPRAPGFCMLECR
jgi:hypothetical protein